MARYLDFCMGFCLMGDESTPVISCLTFAASLKISFSRLKPLIHIPSTGSFQRVSLHCQIVIYRLSVQSATVPAYPRGIGLISTLYPLCQQADWQVTDMFPATALLHTWHQVCNPFHLCRLSADQQATPILQQPTHISCNCAVMSTMTTSHASGSVQEPMPQSRLNAASKPVVLCDMTTCSALVFTPGCRRTGSRLRGWRTT